MFIVACIAVVLVLIFMYKPKTGEPESIIDIASPVLEKLPKPEPEPENVLVTPKPESDLIIKPKPEPVIKPEPEPVIRLEPEPEPVYTGKTVAELHPEEYAKIQAYYERQAALRVIEPVTVLSGGELDPYISGKKVLSYAKNPDGTFRVRLQNNTYELWTAQQWVDYTSPKY